MPTEAPAGRVRLAELVAALSLGIDLGFGQPMEHILRQCLIALRMAERVGLDEEGRAVVYYTVLLINVGCHSDAHEQAKWFGDDIELKSHKYDPAFGAGGLRAAVAGLGSIGRGHRPLHRFRLGLEFMISGHREVDDMIAAHAKIARTLAEQLGLSKGVAAAVGSSYEQWDGRGWPGTLSGAEIPIAARIAALAEYVEVAHRMGGIKGVVTLAEQRGGKQFDPALSTLLREHGHVILDGLDSARAWDAVIDQEPALAVVLSGDELDSALLALANFIDLKSPYTLGHSAAVASLAAAAGAALGLPAVEVALLRRAGLMHGFGRLGVSNFIWDKPGALGAGEWERVRMQPYFTDRMLKQSAALAPIAAIVSLHRERLDGSGYPRGTSGSSISRPGRILAVAEVYQAMREPRPHRAAYSADEAARLTRVEARAGRLDHEVVEAVLGVAGHRTRQRRDGPAGLTAREVEVLRLLARGLSTKQMAERLGVSPKTAGNHVEHIYSKIDAKNRVAASLFAVEHGLAGGLREGPSRPPIRLKNGATSSCREKGRSAISLGTVDPAEHGESPMGFYDRWVLPQLLNQMMDTEALAAERQKCLAGVSGTVLEVGFGSGHNLPWYPEGVRRLVAVDPSRESAKLARKRIAEARFPVEYLPIGGEEIVAPNHSFDSVVSTFTLCTVPDPIATLEQLRRVLKPGGKLFLIEHGLSKDPKVQKWQRRFNAFPNALCGGCNMNRDIRRLVAEGGFEFDQVDEFEMAEAPSVFAFTTRGVASPRRYPDEAARMEARTA